MFSHIKITYTGIISDVDISSFLNKGSHCVLMAFSGCSMHGSPLSERSKF